MICPVARGWLTQYSDQASFWTTADVFATGGKKFLFAFAIIPANKPNQPHML
jgi:hypothetical protein